MADASSLLSGMGSGTEIYSTIGNYLGISVIAVIVLFAVVSIWSIIWKGFALWKASKKNHLVWFIVLLIVNTIGILEILYIYVFSKMNLNNPSQNSKGQEKPKRKR